MRLLTSPIVILIFVVFFSSCKKDRLWRDAQELGHEISFLEGKWRWIYSREEVRENIDGAFGDVVSNDSISADSYDSSYEIEFEREGHFINYKNGAITNEYCIYLHSVFDKPCIQNNSKQFNLVFDEDKLNDVNPDEVLIGCGKEGFDIIFIGSTASNLPVQTYSTEHYHYYYAHFFKRIE